MRRHPDVAGAAASAAQQSSFSADFQALRYEKGSAILSTGALAAFSGAKTGRSPLDKRVVMERNMRGLGCGESVLFMFFPNYRI